MIKIDITQKVRFGQQDGDHLPITRCVCHAEFHPGQFVINIHQHNAMSCPNCGRRLCWNGNVRVYELKG